MGFRLESATHPPTNPPTYAPTHRATHAKLAEPMALRLSLLPVPLLARCLARKSCEACAACDPLVLEGERCKMRCALQLRRLDVLGADATL